FVTADEIKLVSDIAPEAVVELSGGHNRLINTQRQTDQAKRQGEIVKKILALENSDSKAILHANIQKAVKAFSRCERDTGSPEVQIAVWTVRINSLGEHLAVHRKDHHNKRSFVQLLHKRAKMLRYLKRQSLERYHRCLKELGLLPEMVEGEILAPRYVEKEIDTSFRLSNAALDEEITAPGRTTVKVTVDKKTFTICSLIPEKIEQQILDLTFTEGEEVTFEVVGKNAVHLTGNLVPEVDDDDDEGLEYEDDEEEDDMDPESSMQYLLENGLVGDLEDDSDYSLEDEDDIDDASDRIKELPDDEEEAESMSEEEKESARPIPVTQSKQKKKDQKALSTEKRKQPEPEESAKTKKQKVKKEQQQQQQQEKKVEEPSKPSKQTLPGGLIVEDKKIGTGAVASKGAKVGMYYIGKLAKGGKVFDKNTGGKPLTFTLGKGQVIKGWDQGIVGMKVGGERRLTIPAPLAYGKRGAPPDIPGNATL
ncbi:peptidylprolyl isomerase fpr3, partial [Spiromyces aspiralis]